jgi:hypothetical protein
VIGVEAGRYPPVERIARELGERSEVLPVPIPLDCSDGFNEAYYGRPEMLLDPRARLACSAWSFVEDHVVRGFEQALGHDLSSGRWDQRYGPQRTQPFFEGSLKLIVGRA